MKLNTEISLGVVGSWKNPFHGGGMDISLNYDYLQVYYWSHPDKTECISCSVYSLTMGISM